MADKDVDSPMTPSGDSRTANFKISIRILVLDDLEIPDSEREIRSSVFDQSVEP